VRVGCLSPGRGCGGGCDGRLGVSLGLMWGLGAFPGGVHTWFAGVFVPSFKSLEIAENPSDMGLSQALETHAPLRPTPLSLIQLNIIVMVLTLGVRILDSGLKRVLLIMVFKSVSRIPPNEADFGLGLC